jgi:rod shape-determining protein MreB
VLAVGAEAKAMLGKTPGNIVAIRPMRDGVIADFTVTEAMLKYFIAKIHNRRHFVRSRLIISVPAGITSVERKAVREAAQNSGVREVWLIEQPMAAAIGAGLPVREARGNMIVDIGGGTTDVAVVSMAGMVTNVTLKVAGDKLDEAIINYVRRHHNMMIGERTAEMIKIRLGSVWEPEAGVAESTMDMKGRDLITGVPKSIELTGAEVRDALADCARGILEAIKATLEKTPPELAGDISERGIVLAGGGANLRGLDTLIRAEVGIPVFVADEPLLAVVKGVGMVLEDLDGYRSILLS